MEAIKKSNFKKPIIYTKVLDNATLVVVDNDTKVTYVDINTLEFKYDFKANIYHQRYATKLLDFNKKGNKFVSLNSENKEVTVFDIDTNKQIPVTNRNQGEISCIGIDPKERYIFTGGEDGKTFAIDINTDKLAFNLPIHVDTVNDIAFSQNAQWVATASYDKKISLYNIAMMKPKFRLKAHRAPVLKLHFLSDYRLFSVDKDSVGIIWNMHDSKIIKRVDGIHDDVTQITTNGAGDLLFLGTKLGYVLVYDLNTYELIDRRFIKLHDAITSLSFDNKNNNLIVGLNNGELLLYDIYDGEKYINELLKDQNYKEIEEFVKENKLLVYTESYQTVITLWEKTLKLAKSFLGKNDKEKAKQVFGRFLNIPSRRQAIDKLFVEYEEFEKFMTLVSGAKYSLAYSLVNKHPVYKETIVYKSMEAHWKKNFLLAQKTFIKTKSYEKVKEILAPYRGVSEKTQLIQDLLLNANVYERFKNAFNKKDYTTCFTYIKQHSFLKEYGEYTSLQNEADNIYIQSQKLIQKGEKHQAVKLLRLLLDFEEFKVDATNMIIEIQDNL